MRPTTRATNGRSSLVVLIRCLKRERATAGVCQGGVTRLISAIWKIEPDPRLRKQVAEDVVVQLNKGERDAPLNLRVRMVMSMI